MFIRIYKNAVELIDADGTIGSLGSAENYYTWLSAVNQAAAENWLSAWLALIDQASDLAAARGGKESDEDASSGSSDKV